MTQHESLADLYVEPLSHALTGKRIDVVVTGSIGAVRSVEMVRSLRRLGAEVRVTLTKGGAQFITPMALEWASAAPVTVGFRGDATHIATGDACVVAPASASFIGRLTSGATDDAASALVASYLGQSRPVLVLRSMHESLARSPFAAQAWQKLLPFIEDLPSRKEEGKLKFPAADFLADEVAFRLNKRITQGLRVGLTMGTTRGYIDSVRYLSNYSSGALGTAICHELHRWGIETAVVAGPCEVRPRSYSRMVAIETTEEMAQAMDRWNQYGLDGVVMAASVLDYVPSERFEGKIRSNRDQMSIDLRPSPKLLDVLKLPSAIKVGFKLECGLDAARSLEWAGRYIERYGLSLLIANDLNQVDAKSHKAWAVDARSPEETAWLTSKQDIAQHIVGFMRGRFKDNEHR